MPLCQAQNSVVPTTTGRSTQGSFRQRVCPDISRVSTTPRQTSSSTGPTTSQCRANSPAVMPDTARQSPKDPPSFQLDIR